MLSYRFHGIPSSTGQASQAKGLQRDPKASKGDAKVKGVPVYAIASELVFKVKGKRSSVSTVQAVQARQARQRDPK